jgi:hypothetical protein
MRVQILINSICLEICFITAEMKIVIKLQHPYKIMYVRASIAQYDHAFTEQHLFKMNSVNSTKL